jgi:hypothetical protein
VDIIGPLQLGLQGCEFKFDNTSDADAYSDRQQLTATPVDGSSIQNK